MEGMNNLELGGVIVLALGLLEVVKLLAGKLGKNGKNGDKHEKEDRFYCKMGEKQKQQLQTLTDLHCRFDEDGAPLWYFPRSWEKEIVSFLKEHNEGQKTQIDLLNRINTKLTK